jgi:Carboxypeptidase regulatory-like domain
MLRKLSRILPLLLVICGLALTPDHAAGQGVTTASMTGVVKDEQGAAIPGASVVAVHVPSNSSYATVTGTDGRFFIQGMRVGGPYKVTASLSGFATEVKDSLTLTLGVAEDVNFAMKIASMAETVTVVGQADAVFSSSRTGAATALRRDELGALPTISGRINDFARTSPQYGGSGTFAGQDNRMNNITVDGSYFNNAFGLAGQPGDRTGVAPISLEAIEQLQVSVAPYDVRQGNFVGAGVNTVTRSGTNRFTGSVYHRMRNESYVGTEAKGQTFNPGTFDTTDTGEWLGGPIFKNRLFFFESFESQKDTRPLTTYVSNPGGAAATGNTTRVLASDLDALSAFLSSKFDYNTGPYDGISKKTPAKPFLVKGDYNLNPSNKVTFRYNQLKSSTDVNMSSSSSLGFGRQTFSNNFLNFQGSNYTILENIHSGVGEWNSIISSHLSNNLTIGYTKQDESRGQIDPLFPIVDILENGVTYTSFGSEPFTPANKLLYNTFQAQDSLTKFGERHSLTVGASVEKYHSDNSFYPGIQSAYVYNSLADFYTDANSYLANPNRTTSPVTLNKFQVRYSNIPGSTDPPFQKLDVWYTSIYGQDVWKPRSNVTVTAGIRVDVAKFGATGFDNPAVDALTFRDGDGNPVQYNTGALPKTSPLWSPRVGFNWDVSSDQTTQIRGGSGIFTGKPAYVWISNQIGNTGILTGFIQSTNTTAFPFNPNPDTYKPAATGNPPSSADVAVTDPDFKFPQTWRTNFAVDHKLGWGLIGTGEFIYNRDVNGMAYINANLPAAQSAFVGADSRARWTSNRINNVTGNQVVENIVLTNQSIGRSWSFAASVNRPMSHGFAFKSAYSYGRSRNAVDPGSIASGSWTNNPVVSNANNPVLAYSANSPGHRFFFAPSYTFEYFGFGATTIGAFFDMYTGGNTSYVFSGDMNGDGGSSNDLIYIPKDTSEMNFAQFTSSGKTFTAADQAAAFEAYIQQDKYLSKHRGQYAERGAVFYPMVRRLDLSITQDVFHKLGGLRHTGQIRLDITNFGNLINHNWGVSNRIIQNRILTSPSVDAQGRSTYRLATVSTSSGPALLSHTFQTNAGISDVYVMMLSFRYTFQ